MVQNRCPRQVTPLDIFTRAHFTGRSTLFAVTKGQPLSHTAAANCDEAELLWTILHYSRATGMCLLGMLRVPAGPAWGDALVKKMVTLAELLRFVLLTSCGWQALLKSLKIWKACNPPRHGCGQIAGHDQ